MRQIGWDLINVEQHIRTQQQWNTVMKLPVTSCRDCIAGSTDKHRVELIDKAYTSTANRLNAIVQPFVALLVMNLCVI